jgi:hypothetical protein
MNRKTLIVLILAAAGVITGCIRAETRGLPLFEVDSSWPKLPQQWKLGEVASVAVDRRDHVWVLHRPRSLPPGEMAAPAVLEFDHTGNFVRAWGGPADGYEWPEREHGIYVDAEDHVWIGGNNSRSRELPRLKRVNDDQLLKFTIAGKFVMQIGRSDKSTGNRDEHNLRQPADVFVRQETSEAFVADGYGNHRIAVFDARTGAFKRMWGAFGREPIDVERRGSTSSQTGGGNPALQHFNTVHAVRVSNDGLVYVADRGNKRVQVFTPDGNFIREKFVAPETDGLSARALAFSADPQQEHLYVGGQPQIWVLNRLTLEVLGAAASPNAHHFAVDSRGNIYTAETEEKRTQKLVFGGFASSPR